MDKSSRRLQLARDKRKKHKRRGASKDNKSTSCLTRREKRIEQITVQDKRTQSALSKLFIDRSRCSEQKQLMSLQQSTAFRGAVTDRSEVSSCLWKASEVFEAIRNLDLLDDRGHLRKFPWVFNNWQEQESCEWPHWLGYTIPTLGAITALVNHLGKKSRIVSVGAGVALWESLLHQLGGASVLATDPEPRKEWSCFPVQKMSADEINFRAFDCLMLVWPYPASGASGYDSLALRRFRGEFVVFVGMSELGEQKQDRYKVGSREFKRRLRTSSKWELVLRHALPNVHTYHYSPTLFLYRRRNGRKRKMGQCEAVHRGSCDSSSRLCAECHRNMKPKDLVPGKQRSQTQRSRHYGVRKL